MLTVVKRSLTGEEEVLIEGAHHISCTIEKLDLEKEYHVAVIDEVQLIQDSIRGASWTRAILGILSPEIHLCGALNVKPLLIQMITECGDEYECKDFHGSETMRIRPGGRSSR